MREPTLVAFTLLTQLAVGVFWALAGVWWVVGAAADRWVAGPLLAGLPLAAAALAVSFLHLGTPRNAWRALGNLRSSWLSREVLFAVLFAGGWLLLVLPGRWRHAAAAPPSPPALVALSVAVFLVGAGLVYSMARVYRLRTVPAWNTPLTTTTFFITAVSLGALGAAVLAAPPGSRTAETAWAAPALRALMLLGAAGLAVELGLEPLWRRRRRAAEALVDPGLNPQAGVGAWGRAGRWRVVLLAAAFFLAVVAWVVVPAASPWPFTVAAGLAFATALLAAALGRCRFYAGYARTGV